MITHDEAKKLWDLVEPLKTAMLITESGNQLVGRPMHLVQSEFDGTFYFFTATPTEKTEEIAEHHEVCLTFSCPVKQTYVSISGVANVTRDQALIDKLWNPMIAAWFPQGQHDPSVALLKINSYQAEYWQGENRIVQLFKYAKAAISGTQPNVGEHGHLR